MGSGGNPTGIDRPWEALEAVCRRLGLDARGARLLRFTNNAVFRLVSEPLVVRVLGAWSLRHRVWKVVDVARWFERHGLPAIRLWPGAPSQPVRAGPVLATVWWAVPHAPEPPHAAELGRLLRTLHELPVPPFRLPAWEPLADVRRRLGDTDVLSEADRRFLLRRCDAAEERLRDLEFPHRDGLVHGDAHLGNVIRSGAGPLLCDFDSTCVGPPEADLVTLPVGVARFGENPQVYEQFRRAYGYDVTAWAGYGVLRELRELKLVTSALPMVRSNPALAAELFRRLDAFRRGDRSAVWVRYG